MHVKSTKTHNYAHRWAQDKTDALFLTWEPCEIQQDSRGLLAAALCLVQVYLLWSCFLSTQWRGGCLYKMTGIL